MKEEVIQINVGGAQRGMVGLPEVFGEVRKLALDNEERCKEELLLRASRRNYIVASAAEKYKQALWREYRRWLGEPVADEDLSGLTIKILGPGCYACDKLMEDVMDLVAEMNLDAAVEHVRDPVRIGRYGMVGVPALVINNKVKVSGRTPPKGQLREMIAAARAESQ